MKSLILSAGTLFLLLVPATSSSLYGQGKNSSSAEAKSIVRRVAENFGRNYAKNYVAFTEAAVDVRSNGKYIQFMAQDAIIALLDFNQKTGDNKFDEWNAIRYVPLEQYATDLIIPGTKQHLKQWSNINQNVEGINKDYVNFNDDFDCNILPRQAALHKYSPLNVKMIDNYDYRLESKGKDGYIIWFKTAKGFPKPMRIHTEGKLYISLDMGIKAIETTDMEDRYSTLCYYNAKEQLLMVCHYTYRVEYEFINGSIVIQRIIENIRWVEPENKSAKIYYSPSSAPYKHPFKHKISTQTEITFSRHITSLSEKQCQKVKNTMLATDGPDLAFIPSINIDYWSNKLAKLRNKQRILEDLAATQEELNKQAIENCDRYNKEIRAKCLESAKAFRLSEKDTEDHLSNPKRKYISARKRFNEFYGKDLYDR